MARIILQAPHKVLRAKSLPVTDFGASEIKRIIREIQAIVDATPHAVGLAAPQIGYDTRIFEVRCESFRRIFINPVITAYSKKKSLMSEACLSVEGWNGWTERPTKVTIKAFDETGKKFKLTVKGLLAQIIQHELDHLDGVLYIDKAKRLERVQGEGYRVRGTG